VDAEKAKLGRRRISMLCVDAAPNSQLAQEVADRGGGVARFLTSEPSEEDITTALDEVLADWAAPVLVGLRLEVNRQQVEAAGRDLADATAPGWSAVDLGDLPSGRPVWACGRVPLGDGAPSFRLATASGPATGETGAGATDAGKGLLSLFGARRVTGLEYLMNSGREGDDLADALKRLGYDPAKVLAPVARKVYAENARKASADALKPLLVDEALRYGLACAETAFVAVRKEKGKPVQGTVAVANALPASWSDDFASRSAMAPPAPMMMMHAMASGPMPTAPGAGIGGLFKRAAKGMVRADLSVALPSTGGQPEAEPVAAAASDTLVYRGPAVTSGGTLVLADTSTGGDAALKNAVGTITELRLSFPGPGGAPKPADLDKGLALLLYVDDLSSPRAKVRLADLVRQGGKRPLNVMRLAGQTLRIVLVDENGAWATSAPEIVVTLVW
jgi:Ca-activated chloride channel family protein